MIAPSAGALRAGKRIADFVMLSDSTAKVFAEIIDRETASKELAEALRAIVGTPGVRRVSDDLHEQGLAALAKWESRQ